MTRFLLLATLVLVVLVAVYRQRIYLRDPLATVSVGDVELPGARAYINYSNDLLVESALSPGGFRYLVQNWNHAAGTPAALTCLHQLACLAPADHAPTVDTVDPAATLSSREVSFHDAAGLPFRITLR